MPAGEDGSGGSEDSDGDEDDSDEDSDESSEEDDESEEEEEEKEAEDEPLSLEWPDTQRKQATYLFLLPIILPLWLTVPDVRNQVKTRDIDLRSAEVSLMSQQCLAFIPPTLSRRNPENSLWSPSWDP